MPTEDVFPHIATFYSLIVGLAVANVLSSAANAAKSEARVRWYWVHTAAAAMLLLIIAQDWWFLLSWERGGHISHAVLVFLLARAGVLYFASNLLVPEATDAWDDGIIDLRKHFVRVRRRFFVALALFPVLDSIDTLLKGQERLRSLGPGYPVYAAASVVLMLAGGYARSERTSAVIILVVIVSLLAVIVGGAAGRLS
jgi:hypothetical protein